MYGHVQGSCRLVGNKDSRPTGTGDRTSNSLTHPTAHLVWIIPHADFGRWYPDESQRLENPLRKGIGIEPLMNPLGHLIADVGFKEGISHPRSNLGELRFSQFRVATLGSPRRHHNLP